MKYKIPRNVKRGLSFLGLEFQGWVYYTPTVLVLSALAFEIPYPKAQFVMLVLAVILPHFAFQTDEKTGKLNFSFLNDYMKWLCSKKIIEPVWGDEDARQESLQIQLRLFKTKK